MVVSALLSALGVRPRCHAADRPAVRDLGHVLHHHAEHRGDRRVPGWPLLAAAGEVLPNVLTSDRLANSSPTQPGLACLRRRSASGSPRRRSPTRCCSRRRSPTARDRARIWSAPSCRPSSRAGGVPGDPARQAVSSVKVEIIAGPETDGPPGVAPRPCATSPSPPCSVSSSAPAPPRCASPRHHRQDRRRRCRSSPPRRCWRRSRSTPGAKVGPLTLTRAPPSPRAPRRCASCGPTCSSSTSTSPVKTLVVTSALPGEGKSTTACNLAHAFAEAGKRVMIIDADLRRPRIAEYLGLEGAVGLTNVLAGQACVDDVLQRWGRATSGCCPAGSCRRTPANCSAREQHGRPARRAAAQVRHRSSSTPRRCCRSPTPPSWRPWPTAACWSPARKTTSAQVTGAVKALRSVDARLLGLRAQHGRAKGPDAYYYYSDYSSRGRNGDRARRAARREPEVMSPAHGCHRRSRTPVRTVPGASGSARSGPRASPRRRND